MVGFGVKIEKSVDLSRPIKTSLKTGPELGFINARLNLAKIVNETCFGIIVRLGEKCCFGMTQNTDYQKIPNTGHFTTRHDPGIWDIR